MTRAGRSKRLCSLLLKLITLANERINIYLSSIEHWESHTHRHTRLTREFLHFVFPPGVGATWLYVYNGSYFNQYQQKHVGNGRAGDGFQGHMNLFSPFGLFGRGVNCLLVFHNTKKRDHVPG